MLLQSLLFVLSLSQSDGNPHNWDRIRRCDAIDYSPKCGVCEGVGGIVWGDDPNDYTPTKCLPVAVPGDIDPSTLKRPDWAVEWYAAEYYGILIGPKNDPFCFQVFPSNSSEGNLCYQPQQGPQAYDMLSAFGLRYDLQVKTVVGNISSKIIAQDTNFWIVNKYPWYLGGFTQCICTQAKEGGTGAPVYPLQYNWTDLLSYVGREKIDIEYIWEEQVEMDHWSYGPHHVWTEPDTGKLIRMWQPFNGLQIFPQGTSLSYVDASNFTDLPPPECKKGGALMRVKCTDDGYPDVSEEQTLLQEEDLRRAKTWIPGHDFRGENFDDMSIILNTHLENSGVKTKECEDWSHNELQELQQVFHSLKHEGLNSLYALSGDPRHIPGTQDYSRINDLAKELDLEHVVRDGHCHEAVMWFVHHLTKETKEILIRNAVTLPLLSYNRHFCPDGASAGERELFGAYEQQVTCMDCHSNVKPPQRRRR